MTPAEVAAEVLRRIRFRAPETNTPAWKLVRLVFLDHPQRAHGVNFEAVCELVKVSQEYRKVTPDPELTGETPF